MQKQSYIKTRILFEEYADLIVYGQHEEDEALQLAVEYTFRKEPDDFRADLYSCIKTKWDAVEINARFIATEKILKEVLGE